MNKHYVAVKTSVTDYQHFEVPEPVKTYIMQLEHALNNPRVADTLKQLYPRLNINQNTEADLIHTAETHPDDARAQQAMQELRDRFDITYGWCIDCDGLVCKRSDCCLYQTNEPDTEGTSTP